MQLKYSGFRNHAAAVLSEAMVLHITDLLAAVPLRLVPTRNEAASVLQKDERFIGLGDGLWELAEVVV
jgi:hypothetical protein